MIPCRMHEGNQYGSSIASCAGYAETTHQPLSGMQICINSKTPVFPLLQGKTGVILLLRCPKSLCFQGFSDQSKALKLIPTRCRNLHLKQFCLSDITPILLIVLIIHIIIAVRWMFIKILSAVINHHEEYALIVAGGLTVL